MFTTYQVNAIRYSGFHETKVHLDNQADISIMRPVMPHTVEPAEKKVHVNGERLQLMINRMGYLDEFFMYMLVSIQRQKY